MRLPHWEIRSDSCAVCRGRDIPRSRHRRGRPVPSLLTQLFISSSRATRRISTLDDMADFRNQLWPAAKPDQEYAGELRHESSSRTVPTCETFFGGPPPNLAPNEVQLITDERSTDLAGAPDPGDTRTDCVATSSILRGDVALRCR